MFVLGLAGGTASGKSTLARALAASLGDALLVLAHDRYYFDVPSPRGHNYDHPDALDTAELVRNLDQLRAGVAADLPVYAFATHTRQPARERVAPRPIVLVEGILVMADPALRARMDFKVFVEAADDLRLVRRLRRDIVERGRDVEGVLEQYLTTVRPMHRQFVAPSRQHADLVVSGETSVRQSLARVVDALRVVGVVQGAGATDAGR